MCLLFVGHAIALLDKSWILTIEAHIQSQVRTYEICSGHSGSGGCFSLTFFSFHLLFNI
jgi:hypothetical protein